MRTHPIIQFQAIRKDKEPEWRQLDRSYSKS